MANKPKLEFQVNVPTVFEAVKCFKSGESEYGAWHGWSVKHNGEEKTLFADDELNRELTAYKGKIVRVVWQEVKQEGKRAYRIWKVAQAEGFDDRGGFVEQPRGLDTPEGLDSYRNKVRDALFMAYSDVDAVVMQFAEQWQDKAAAERLFTPDVRQKLATSILIDYLKRT